MGYHIFYLLPEVKEMNLFGMIFRVPTGAEFCKIVAYFQFFPCPDFAFALVFKAVVWHGGENVGFEHSKNCGFWKWKN